MAPALLRWRWVGPLMQAVTCCIRHPQFDVAKAVWAMARPKKR